MEEPFRTIADWVADAFAAGLAEPNAMTVATADQSGRPSARTVLCKGVDERGFVFFTNYESRKGRELAVNPRAAVVWAWPSLHRQVTATGDVVRVSGDESDAYFATRARGSQLGAWASAQSTVIADRGGLERAYAEADARFAGRDVERPPYWGGFLVVPDNVELWMGRPDRLHDRFRYSRETPASPWVKVRLAP
jgi:pyridoxamine 5'-phosphate oxidase